LVYKWCRQSGLPASEAADVGQEVFWAVAQAIATFHHERERGTFRGWLRTITHNKVRDYGRRVHNQPQGVGGSDAARALDRVRQTADDSAGAAWEDRVLCRRAADLIRTEFPPQYWEAFWRVAVQRDRPADVAADLGMSVSTVYVARCRILARLREEFAGLIEFDPNGRPAGEASDAGA
jgi:RNA polymerase sigma-70 factor (ECF subfamily)